MTNKRELKAYVRIDGSHRMVPSSLILRKNKPKVGRWEEVDAYECCNTPAATTSTTTTTQETLCLTYVISLGVREEATLYYTDCYGEEVVDELQGPYEDTICAQYGSVILTPDGIAFPLGECYTTTTTSSTTSTSSTTTTTTTIPG